MLSVMSNFSVMGCPIASSFRGALLREPGIHNPDSLHIIPTCGYGFRARGQEPAPRNDLINCPKTPAPRSPEALPRVRNPYGPGGGYGFRVRPIRPPRHDVEENPNYIQVSAPFLRSLRQELRKLGPNAGIKLLAGTRLDRERIAPRPWLAGVDDDAGVARVLVAVGHGIERGAPASPQHLDVLARIEPRAHRPDHLVHVGRIDVVVDHNHPAVRVSAGVALRCDQAGLLGMAAVHLLDGDGEPKPAAARLMGPHAPDLRNAGGFELVPHRTAPVGAAIEGVVVGRHAGHGAEQHRIIAVPEGLDADRRLALLAARVIAGPLAEPALIGP